MSDAFASVSCSVEIYPFEAGRFTLQGGQIRSATVSKSLRGNAAGTFSIDLHPAVRSDRKIRTRGARSSRRCRM